MGLYDEGMKALYGGLGEDEKPPLGKIKNGAEKMLAQVEGGNRSEIEDFLKDLIRFCEKELRK
jgi:hypothetical protein